jgi:putative transcriptional regulator
MTKIIVNQTNKIVKWRRRMILRNRLKERRAALNVNQQEMGRLCGVSRQTISLIERGDYSPSVTLALTIAKVCGVTVEEIFYLQEETEDGKR